MKTDATSFFKTLGLSEKDALVYTSLLKMGNTSVRKLASFTGLNRGSTYEALKRLIKEGFVSHFQKEKKQFFSAEDPSFLEEYLVSREEEQKQLHVRLKEIMPELKTLHRAQGMHPVTKFYEGSQGVRRVLEDVLATVQASGTKEYFVYSSADLRTYLYQGFKNFTEQRIAQKINVKVIAFGSGGEEQAYSERRWLADGGSAPTYTIIYHTKVAFISLMNGDTPVAVVIEDENTALTQQKIFLKLWATLKT